MEKIEFKNGNQNNTPINATNLNQLQDNVEDAINIVDNKFVSFSSSPELTDSINNSNTNIALNESGNICVLNGVIYFTAKPATWTKFIGLPAEYQNCGGYGVLVEESTGLTRPIIIQNGNVLMSAEISTAPLYAYIFCVFAK